MRGPIGGSKAANNENGDNTLDIQGTPHASATDQRERVDHQEVGPQHGRGEVLVDLTEMGQDEPSEDLFPPSRVRQTLD